MTITIETLEAIATEIEADEEMKRDRLLRLIAAFARMISIREPDNFKRRATEFRDEDGHFDNSYPPDQEYRNHTGPRLVKIRENKTEHVAISSGFYYDWKCVTTDAGVYISTDGSIYGCDEHGTGSLGRFAAYPGDCNVEIDLEWSERQIEDVSTNDLSLAEKHLRKLAFPAIAEKLEKVPA